MVNATNDTTMFDRVAGVLDEQLARAFDERYELTGPDVALIVFMAMREPTLAMCKAGRGALNADALLAHHDRGGAAGGLGMNEMVERVAVAVEAAAANEGMIEEAWQRMARVAIEAMREPTKVMLRAGSEYIADADHSGHRRTEAERKSDEAWEGTAARKTAYDVWESMINEALR